MKQLKDLNMSLLKKKLLIIILLNIKLNMSLILIMNILLNMSQFKKCKKKYNNLTLLIFFNSIYEYIFMENNKYEGK